MGTGLPRLAARVGATLGEGPVWVAREQALWFVDIKRQRVYRFDPATGDLRHWDVGAQVGWILPAQGGGFVVGLQSGPARFDPATGTVVPIADPEPHLPGNRLNDATVDAQGRIWFGTMDDAEDAATGHFHVLDQDGTRHAGLPPVEITNGPAFSPDGTILYHTDTLGRTIHASPVHDGAIAGPSRIFARIEDGAGYPDGPTVDSAGNVWTGLFGGSGVRCYAPDGTVREQVRLPAANVTKIAFGGPDLRTAYATTARKGLDAAALAAQPGAGDLFAFDVDIPGLLQPEAVLR